MTQKEKDYSIKIWGALIAIVFIGWLIWQFFIQPYTSSGKSEKELRDLQVNALQKCYNESKTQQDQWRCEEQIMGKVIDSNEQPLPACIGLPGCE